MNQHRRLGRRQVLYRSRDVCRWPDAITDPRNDNLDRMTAKLVSTPTLGRALRFWREHYVADREWGSWSSAVRDLSPLSIARTADRDHDHVVAPVLQMHQLRVRVVRCALVRRGRRSHRRAIAVDLCRAAALITPRRHDIRRVPGLRHTGAGCSRSSRRGFATTGAVPVGFYGPWNYDCACRNVLHRQLVKR